MNRPICKDIIFLKKKAVKATKDDLSTGKDLLDTLIFHKNECVGLAANMIGVNKAIIVVNMGMLNVVMYNPKITKKEKPYTVMEGCLSLEGQRTTIRYESITVEYEDSSFNKKTMNLNGFYAQIVQHEIDHLNGIMI
ncbi:MAG: peptide deformylase [Erysipelotrichaceae bacterium]|nr:peptide deformylase [Erysipelotrichaceae bacterium]